MPGLSTSLPVVTVWDAFTAPPHLQGRHMDVTSDDVKCGADRLTRGKPPNGAPHQSEDESDPPLSEASLELISEVSL